MNNECFSDLVWAGIATRLDHWLIFIIWLWWLVGILQHCLVEITGKGMANTASAIFLVMVTQLLAPWYYVLCFSCLDQVRPVKRSLFVGFFFSLYPALWRLASVLLPSASSLQFPSVGLDLYQTCPPGKWHLWIDEHHHLKQKYKTPQVWCYVFLLNGIIINCAITKRDLFVVVSGSNRRMT